MRGVLTFIRGGRRRDVVDAAAVVALAVAAQVETWAPGGMSGARPVASAGALVGTVALMWRRRAPLAVALVVVATMPVQAAAGVSLDERLYIVVAVLAAMYALGMYARRSQAWLGEAAGALAVAVADLVGGGRAPAPEDLFIVIVWVLLPCELGRLAAAHRTRAERFAALAEELDRRREEDVHRAAADERERIAREIHDVVAHSVSLMLVQATGGHRRLRERDLASAEAALASIEAIGRQALGDLRRALALMRDGDDGDGIGPQPGLSALPELAERAEEAGVGVALEVRGNRRPVSPGLDLAAFRIVQEAVTNVAKHAPGATAEVAVTFAPTEVDILVRNEPGSAAASSSRAATPGGGHGLIGMRERVSAYGGRLDAGPVPGGGYRVHARLPIDRAMSA